MFENYLNHDDEIIREIATRLQELSTDRSSGNITDKEFKEVYNDMLELVEINTISESIERKARIENAIAGLKSILSNI